MAMKKCRFLSKDKRVVSCGNQNAKILILSEAETKEDFFRDLSPEIEHLVSSAGRCDEELKSFVGDLIEEPKDGDEVGFSGAVGADEHVQTPELDLLVTDGLETLNSNAIKASHGSGLL